MACELVWSDDARKKMSKLDKTRAVRIIKYMRDVSQLEDPTVRGKALVGNLSGLWRYRVGDYRVVCDLYAGQMTIFIIDVDKRSQIYRG